MVMPVAMEADLVTGRDDGFDRSRVRSDLFTHDKKRGANTIAIQGCQEVIETVIRTIIER